MLRSIKRRFTLGELFLALFLLTALVGVWSAYDRSAAWYRFGLLALGVLIVWVSAWAGQLGGERTFSTIIAGSAFLAALSSVYFLLCHDWSAAGPVKFAAIQRAGLWIQTYRPVLPPVVGDINPNLAGNVLAVTLPLVAGGLVLAHRRSGWLTLTYSLVLLLGAFAALLTASRGAWTGLAAGALAAGCLAWGAQHSRPTRRQTNVILAGAIALLFGAFWVALAMLGVAPLLGQGAVRGADMSRPIVWQDMLPLVVDYPLTGSGLGSTTMVYSTYVRLLHVPFLSHAHNLFLQIAIEQGLPGLLAFIGLLVWTTRHLLNEIGSVGLRQEAQGMDTRLVQRLAAVASLVALTVHGMVEAELYVSHVLPVLFLPFGLAWAARAQTPAGVTRERTATSLQWPARLALVSILGLVLLLVPGMSAITAANLGAVAQTRAELSAYRWPTWPIQDALRRSPQVDLGPAITYYTAALRLDPTNPTANRRLGQIELARGEYSVAEAHLDTAYRVAPGERAARQLRGESYAIRGDVVSAASLWRTIDVSQGQLAIREWWYAYNGDGQRAGWIAEASKLL